MAASQAQGSRSLSPTELIAEVNRIMDKILGFGEDVPQLLSELRSIRDSVARIAVMVGKRFGVSAPGGDSEALVLDYDANDKVAAEVFRNPEVQEKERKLLSASQQRDPNTVVAASDAGRSAGAPQGVGMERGTIRDIIMFFVQNPQLLQMILSLFRLNQNKPS